MISVAIWLILGFVIGYSLGVAVTTMKYVRRMEREIHECHRKICTEEGTTDA